jgi:NAD(P)-dependent dehydrogenase (short-subunit alcohol dehydrogenase family)
LQINLVAAADLCRLALLAFKDQSQGIIINMASRSSHRGDDAEHLAYGAAKGGLLALTKGIARGYGEQGVLAYALAPGWVRTDMAEDFIARVGEEEVTKNLPLREVTPPEDVAAMVSFLASGRCRHATGSTIDITGADYVR